MALNRHSYHHLLVLVNGYIATSEVVVLTLYGDPAVVKVNQLKKLYFSSTTKVYSQLQFNRREKERKKVESTVLAGQKRNNITYGERKRQTMTLNYVSVIFL